MKLDQLIQDAITNPTLEKIEAIAEFLREDLFTKVVYFSNEENEGLLLKMLFSSYNEMFNSFLIKIENLGKLGPFIKNSFIIMSSELSKPYLTTHGTSVWLTETFPEIFEVYEKTTN